MQHTDPRARDGHTRVYRQADSASARTQTGRKLGNRYRRAGTHSRGGWRYRCCDSSSAAAGLSPQPSQRRRRGLQCGPPQADKSKGVSGGCERGTRKYAEAQWKRTATQRHAGAPIGEAWGTQGHVRNTSTGECKANAVGNNQTRGKGAGARRRAQQVGAGPGADADEPEFAVRPGAGRAENTEVEVCKRHAEDAQRQDGVAHSIGEHMEPTTHRLTRTWRVYIIPTPTHQLLREPGGESPAGSPVLRPGELPGAVAPQAEFAVRSAAGGDNFDGWPPVAGRHLWSCTRSERPAAKASRCSGIGLR